MKYLLAIISALSFLFFVKPASALDWTQPVARFEFKDADINAVIVKIGQLTGRNFIVDPGVRGKITITQNAPLTLDNAYKAFLSTLAINGFTVLQNGDHWLVRSARNAQRDNIEIIFNKMPPDENRMMTLYVLLDHISADEVNKNLRIIPSKDGEMAPYPPANALIISDYGPNLIRIWKLIRELDQPPSKERSKLLKEFAEERKARLKNQPCRCAKD